MLSKNSLLLDKKSIEEFSSTIEVYDTTEVLEITMPGFKARYTKWKEKINVKKVK